MNACHQGLQTDSFKDSEQGCDTVLILLASNDFRSRSRTVLADLTALNRSIAAAYRCLAFSKLCRSSRPEILSFSSTTCSSFCEDCRLGLRWARGPAETPKYERRLLRFRSAPPSLSSHFRSLPSSTSSITGVMSSWRGTGNGRLAGPNSTGCW